MTLERESRGGKKRSLMGTVAWKEGKSKREGGVFTSPLSKDWLEWVDPRPQVALPG
jgi:hypothetical protein